jgi:hypothetical protein
MITPNASSAPLHAPNRNKLTVPRRLIGRFDGLEEMDYILLMKARLALSLPSQRDGARVRHAHEDGSQR